MLTPFVLLTLVLSVLADIRKRQAPKDVRDRIDSPQGWANYWRAEAEKRRSNRDRVNER